MLLMFFCFFLVMGFYIVGKKATPAKYYYTKVNQIKSRTHTHTQPNTMLSFFIWDFCRWFLLSCRLILVVCFFLLLLLRLLLLLFLFICLKSFTKRTVYLFSPVFVEYIECACTQTVHSLSCTQKPLQTTASVVEFEN